MQIQPISVKYLRENFSLVKQRLKNGFSFLLIYRSEPIARIEPVKNRSGGIAILKNLITPPEQLQFKSSKSAVDIVRGERN